jgi:hypothetical protein
MTFKWIQTFTDDAGSFDVSIYVLISDILPQNNFCSFLNIWIVMLAIKQVSINLISVVCVL